MNATITLPNELIEALAQATAELNQRPAPDPEGSTFVTVKVAAEDILCCKPQRVRDLLSQGVLTRYKDGARTLLLRSEVEAYIYDSAERLS